MRKLIFTLILLPFWMGKATEVQAQDSRFSLKNIYFVDMQTVLDKSKVGKSAMSDLRKQMNESQEKIGKLKSEIDSMKSTLDKQASLLSDAAFKQKQEEIINRNKEAQVAVDQEREKVERLRLQVVSKVVTQAQKSISDISAKKGYPLIVEKGSPIILYADKSFDITAEVISSIGG